MENKSEYPLNSPYEFEGFTSVEEILKELNESMKIQLFQSQSVIGVLREGENKYSTWGYLLIWNDSEWVHKGYTLEPRSNAGKGHISIGNYFFNRWISPTLKKTLRVHNVPKFTNILIHVGNTQSDTKGYILAAKKVDRTNNPTRLVNSLVITKLAL